MNKQEFIQKVSQLKRDWQYSDDDYHKKSDRDSAFNQCKEKVANLALQLDEQGLTIEAYNLFRQQTNDLATAYAELLNVQHELFEARKEIANLRQQLNEYDNGDGDK